MVAGRLAALAAATAAAVLVPAAFAGGGADSSISIRFLSASPRPPQAGTPFELLARVEFGGSLGSIHCRVWVGGRRTRAVRMTWENSVARCTLTVPLSARGKVLTVGIEARQGGSRARSTHGFRVA